jgi:hypothetical protein
MTSGVKRGVGLTKGVEEGGTGGIKNYSLQTSTKFRKIAKTKAICESFYFFAVNMYKYSKGPNFTS